MNVKRQRLVFVVFNLLVLVCLVVAAVIVFVPRAHDANATSVFPTHYFAPYAEIGVGDSLTKVEQTTGQKYFTLAFATSNGSSCKASYPKPTADIAFIQSQGGDVIQSFGGASGKELAQTCTSASSLQAQYQSVVSTLGLTHLDFDIEGGQESDAATYTRRNTALAALQQANPGLTISFTLPAATNGLESGSISLLKDAIAKGVNFNMVNLMTMDYGNTSNDEGDATISSANGFYHQLKQIFPSKTSSQLWGMIGVTDLIGQNDDSEIFTASDGAKVLSFATQNQIGELSFWAVSRDNGSCPGSTNDSDTCDGLSQSSYAFTNSWKSFTNGSSASSTSTRPTASGSKKNPGPPKSNAKQSSKSTSTGGAKGNSQQPSGTSGGKQSGTNSNPGTNPTPTPHQAPPPTPALTSFSASGGGSYDTPVNLSNVGSIDWVHWGYGGGYNVDSKSGATQYIGPVSWNASIRSDTDQSNDFSWYNGTPHSSVSGITSGTDIPGTASFSVRSDPTPHTLTLYLGAYRAQGTLVISFGGTTVYTSNFNMSNDPTNAGDNTIYVIHYSSNVTSSIDISYSMTIAGGSAHCVILEAATIS